MRKKQSSSWLHLLKNTTIKSVYTILFNTIYTCNLKDATAYAHRNGIIVKGDLPIGIYRYGCDAWMSPGLYNMDEQAGAPPDDFCRKGPKLGLSYL
jgi:4-alpha-glucanotransferase